MTILRNKILWDTIQDANTIDVKEWPKELQKQPNSSPRCILTLLAFYYLLLLIPSKTFLKHHGKKKDDCNVKLIQMEKNDILKK